MQRIPSNPRHQQEREHPRPLTVLSRCAPRGTAPWRCARAGRRGRRGRAPAAATTPPPRPSGHRPRRAGSTPQAAVRHKATPAAAIASSPAQRRGGGHGAPVMGLRLHARGVLCSVRGAQANQCGMARRVAWRALTRNSTPPPGRRARICAHLKPACCTCRRSEQHQYPSPPPPI